MKRSAVIVAVSMMSISAHALADHPGKLNLPAGELIEALKALARQADVELVYTPEQVKGIHTKGLRGDYTAPDAVNLLLKGTPLQVHTDETGAMVIALPTAPAPGKAHSTSENTQESRDGNTSHSGDSLRLAQASRGAAQSAASVAQQSDQASQMAPAVLQEVVVTAQKREERLIDVPASVSVISPVALQQNGATQFRDFANTIPGLSFNTSGAGRTQITLRGVTTGIDVSSTVGVYVNDVQIGSSSAYARGNVLALDAALVDLDHIEVLRGPQGTLYGASTMGGLIKYQTRSASLTASSGDLHTGVSTTRDGGTSYNEAFVIDTPLVADKVGLRASGFYNHDGGYVDDIGLGRKDVNNADIYGGRVGLLAEPLSNLSIRLEGMLQNIRRDGTNEADFAQDGTPTYGALLQSRRIPEPFDQHFRLISANVKYDFGFAEITSVSSYQYMDAQTALDVSPLYSAILSSLGYNYSAVGVTYDISTKKYTQEVRLASPTTSALISWLAGGYYTHESSNQPQGFSLRDTDGNPAPDTVYSSTIPSTYEEVAGFGDLTLNLTRDFSVTGGLRYAHIKQHLAQQNSGIFGNSSTDIHSEENKTTYLVNARYRLNDHVSPYLRFATGYRPGGANSVGADPATGQPLAPPSFKSDSLKSYEAGIKAETEDHRFAIDAAGYYIDWSNFQVVTSRNGFGVILNAPGGAAIRGAELTLTSQPSDGLVASSAFAFQDAHLSEDAPDLGGVNGERLPNVPRFTANVALDYTVRSVLFTPTVGASFNYNSNKFASFNDSKSYPQFAIPSSTTVDLRAGAEFASIRANLYVRNLLDRRGEYSADTTVVALGQPAQVSMQQPRTIGLSLSKHF